MRSVLILIMIALIAAASPAAGELGYSIGLSGGLSTIDGDSTSYNAQANYGGNFTYNFASRYSLRFGISRHQIKGDSANFGPDWQALKIAAGFQRALFDRSSRLNLDLKLGGGLLSWKVKDASADTVINVRGPHTEPVEFKANEVFVSGGAGLSISLSSRLALELAFEADYLTGTGTEFASSIKDERGRWLYNGIIGLNFSFGFGRPTLLPSDTKTSQLVPVHTLGSGRLSDGDGDGVLNVRDKCPNTPIGSIVDENGCAIDSDGDGVSDGLDHCPRTSYRARGLVDIYGCPIDSDFDGVVDYLDKCPHGAVGAVVDSSGCPVDSDVDGVPDGLDDCPNTLYGVEVDRNGCIDLAMLAEPMVLNIDYTPGSFEVDPANLERLRRLARLLNFVPHIKLEINGYTDNIGTTRANRVLSKKRADRVRLYLSTMGVDEERIRTFGKGEVDFVASNQTAEGRGRNRRISIIFYQ